MTQVDWYADATEAYSIDKSNYCYLPIKKNATNWGLDFFNTVSKTTKLEEFIIHRHLYYDKKFIIFLRDPLERWYSGIAQWYAERKVSHNFKLDPLTIELLCQAVKIDVHTERQTMYFYFLEYDDCVFFNLDDTNFVNNLTKFLEIKAGFPKLNVSIPKKYTSDELENKKSIIRQLKKALKDNPKYLEQVKRFYQEDYNFMANCKFYTFKQSL